MKLYTQVLSCSSAAHLALLESGVDFEMVPVSLRGDRMLPDGRHLSDISPLNYVPALEMDDGEIVTECLLVLQRIADLNPDAELAPKWEDKQNRLELIKWLGFIAAELQKVAGPLMTLELSDKQREMVLNRLNPRLQFVDKCLAEQDYLMGDKLSVADCHLYIVLSWRHFMSFDVSTYSNLVAFIERVEARQAYKTYLEQIAPHMPEMS